MEDHGGLRNMSSEDHIRVGGGSLSNGLQWAVGQGILTEGQSQDDLSELNEHDELCYGIEEL